MSISQKIKKVIILGNHGVGKTSLVNYIADKTLVPEGDKTYRPSEIVEGYVEKIYRGEFFRIYDTNGTEKYGISKIRGNYFLNVDAVIFCYSLKDQKSYSDISLWRKQFFELSKRKALFYLCGTNYDTKDPIITTNGIYQDMKSYKISLLFDGGGASKLIEDIAIDLTSLPRTRPITPSSLRLPSAATPNHQFIQYPEISAPPTTPSTPISSSARNSTTSGSTYPRGRMKVLPASLIDSPPGSLISPINTASPKVDMGAGVVYYNVGVDTEFVDIEIADHNENGAISEVVFHNNNDGENDSQRNQIDEEAISLGKCFTRAFFVVGILMVCMGIGVIIYKSLEE